MPTGLFHVSFPGKGAGLSFSGWLNRRKTAPVGELFGRKGYLLCGPWLPPGPEGRDGAAEGGEEGLTGALADGGGDAGLETEGGGLLGRLIPGLDGEGREEGMEGLTGRLKSGLDGRLPSGRLMPGR